MAPRLIAPGMRPLLPSLLPSARKQAPTVSGKIDEFSFARPATRSPKIRRTFCHLLALSPSIFITLALTTPRLVSISLSSFCPTSLKFNQNFETSRASKRLVTGSHRELVKFATLRFFWTRCPELFLGYGNRISRLEDACSSRNRLGKEAKGPLFR